MPGSGSIRRAVILALHVFVGVSITAAPIARATDGCPEAAGALASAARLVPAIESFALENGLRVHLVPRASDRSVSVRVVYDVGARDEEEGRGGVAHLFEHMMFKGSARVPDGGHFRLVRDVGGRTNAITDYDTTQYWNTVPPGALERVLFAEADRMRSLRLGRETLDNQRAAIREEGLGLENLPYVKAATAFGLALWDGTPYGHSPLGTPEELAATTPEEAEAFHARFYAPGNAVLVVAGRFDPARARAIVEREFGALPRGASRPERGRVEVDATPHHAVASDPLAPFPVYAVVFTTVGARHEDALALAVTDALLAGDPDARFTRAIVRPLTLDAYSAPLAFRDVGLLNYVFVPRTFVGFDEIHSALREQLASLRAGGPEPAELCRAVARLRSTALSRLGTAESVAAEVARGAVFFDDPRAFETHLRVLEATAASDVVRVARRYLVDEANTLEIRPEGAMRWIKTLLEWLPASVGRSLEASLL